MKITILKMRWAYGEEEVYVYEGHVDKNALCPTILEFFNHYQPTESDLRELGYMTWKGEGNRSFTATYDAYKAYYEEKDMWIDVDYRETLTITN